MSVTVRGQVGPQVLSDGTEQAVRLGKTGEQSVADAHGKYYEANYRAGLFHACMSAGVIFPAPAATAANVMTLANPAGSGRNLVLISFDMVMTIIPGTPLTGLYGLYVNNNPIAAAVTGTALTPINGFLGYGGAPVGKAFTTSTVPVAPTLLWPFGQKVTGEVAAVDPISGQFSFHIDFDGQVILGQGTAITPQQTVADTTNASVICRFAWEEVVL